MSPRRLTPDEANARLPLVLAVASDAAEICGRLAQAQDAYRAERRRPLPSQLVLNDVHAGLVELRRDLAACVAELAGADARLDDPAHGVVDFPSVLDGSDVVLCWRLGDERVEHFHDEDESHDARRPLPVPVTA